MNFIFWIFIGFAAQIIDGTMGMAYGVSCRTFLCSITGLSSSVASAVVHCAEIPVSLASGISHFKLNNVDVKLLIKLIIPGVIGGIIGAWLITDMGDILEPWVNGYLIIMGGIIIAKALIKKSDKPRRNSHYIYPLGLIGGFVDAVGGGGWGPVVTSTMTASGNDVKKTIGTVNAAEFFVTVAQTTTFFTLMVDYSTHLQVITALVIGGVIAAPIATMLCKKLPVKPLMIAIGILIIGLNVFNLYNFFK